MLTGSINVPNIDQRTQLAQQLQNASSLDTGSQTDAATSAMQKVSCIFTN